MPSISVLLIAQDEAVRIEHAIASCQSFADEIVVIDGGSRDDTQTVARALGCRVIENPWPGYAKQRNFGAAAAAHAWIFFLDADEIVGADLQAALRQWKAGQPTASAYAVRRIGDFLGRWLDTNRGELLVRLYDRTRVTIPDVPVHERPAVEPNQVVPLRGRLWHHGFRSISDHVARFDRYTTLEAEQSFRLGAGFSLVRLVFRPPARFLHRYFARGLCLRGVAGFSVAMLWVYYEFLREIKLYELQLRRGSRPTPGGGCDEP
jgi:glycosyltransferase involved in cell wall biosynthesis